MTFKEFLLEQIKIAIEIIGLKYDAPYQAFVLDAVSIEFMGKVCRCTNINEIDESGKSESDFTYVIENYFPVEYKTHAKLLYNDLRCGMTHFFGPKSKLSLTTRSINGHYNLETLPNKKILLVFEEFHKDLGGAIDKIISENKPLLDKEFLNISKS
jgi:hypothetical protein